MQFAASHNIQNNDKIQEVAMRALSQIVAVAAVVMFALGVKAVIPTPTAVAAANARIDVMQMQASAPSLPAQYVHDMTFALE
jgi:hypothetical protein